MARCTSTYGAITLAGKPLRCELAAGHDGMHGHSFAARYWSDDDAAAPGRLPTDRVPEDITDECGIMGRDAFGRLMACSRPSGHQQRGGHIARNGARIDPRRA